MLVYRENSYIFCPSNFELRILPTEVYLIFLHENMFLTPRLYNRNQ